MGCSIIVWLSKSGFATNGLNRAGLTRTHSGKRQRLGPTFQDQLVGGVIGAAWMLPYAKVYAIVGRVSRRHRGHICGPNFGAPKRRLQVRDHVPLQALHFGRFRVAYPCPLLPYFCLPWGLRDRRRRPEISKTARYRKTCICVVCAIAFAVVLDAWRMRWASHENIGGETNTRDTEQIPQRSRRADLRRNRYPVP